MGEFCDYNRYVSDPEWARTYSAYQKKYEVNPRESDKKSARLVLAALRDMPNLRRPSAHPRYWLLDRQFPAPPEAVRAPCRVCRRRPDGAYRERNAAITWNSPGLHSKQWTSSTF